MPTWANGLYLQSVTYLKINPKKCDTISTQDLFALDAAFNKKVFTVFLLLPQHISSTKIRFLYLTSPEKLILGNKQEVGCKPLCKNPPDTTFISGATSNCASIQYWKSVINSIYLNLFLTKKRLLVQQKKKKWYRFPCKRFQRAIDFNSRIFLTKTVSDQLLILKESSKLQLYILMELIKIKHSGGEKNHSPMVHGWAGERESQHKVNLVFLEGLLLS